MSHAATAALRTSHDADELARALSMRLEVTTEGADFGELTRRSGAHTAHGVLELPDLTGLSSADAVIDCVP